MIKWHKNYSEMIEIVEKDVFLLFCIHNMIFSYLKEALISVLSKFILIFPKYAIHFRREPTRSDTDDQLFLAYFDPKRSPELVDSAYFCV